MQNQKMHLALKSIYLRGDAMWFNLHLKNKSLIGYTPYSTRFIIRDKKRSKRSAIQEIELQPDLAASLNPFFVRCPYKRG